VFTSARLRKRLHALTARFAPDHAAEPVPSVDEAMTSLERVVDAHLAEEARASATEDRLLRALDAIPQGIVLADDEGTVVFRNRPASGFFAARHSEALVEAAIADLIAEAVHGVAGTRTLDLYGPPRLALLLRSVPLGDEARPDGAFVVVEDVSERQRLDAVRRDFVANISHELKTPVGALGLLAETIAMQDDPVVTQRLAERMQQEAFRVARTIDDLLELSRIEAEEHPPREPVRLDLVVAEAVDRTAAAAELRDVSITVLHVSPRITVIGDRRQLVSAAANLLDNAVKYSEPGEAVEVRGRTDGRWAEIAVIDHGIGIPARDLERVFERFYRVDRARTRETGESGGTGLGLAIVRHVVSNHNGEVRVDSREGEGSTFTLRLPAGPGPAAIDDLALDPVHEAG
jgi:two-component system sensor histidine kinase SenX3